MFPYEPTIEQSMKDYFETLSEKDRRRYAGVEALKLGRGGITYIAKLLVIRRKTVLKGMKEVFNLSAQEKRNKRIRKKGGGRKRYNEKHPDIDEKFLAVLKNYTAGDPMDEKVRWTNLKPWQIAKLLEERYDLRVSLNVVGQLLKKHNYRRRKAQKRTSRKNVAHRNEQFEKIIRLKADYEAAGNPVVSMDTKKKEHLGNLYRAGQLYTLEEVRTLDHDFVSYAEGIVIPHSIYDFKHNRGYINLGTSKDTTQFACDCFRNWWNNEGRFEYPKAPPSWSCVTGTGVTVLVITSSKKTSKSWLMKSGLKYVLPITRPIVPNTIPLNIVCSPTSLGLVRALFSKA